MQAVCMGGYMVNWTTSLPILLLSDDVANKFVCDDLIGLSHVSYYYLDH